MQGKLTDEQIENWREVLSIQFGPYALVMSWEQIKAARDKIQNEIESQRRVEVKEGEQ